MGKMKAEAAPENMIKRNFCRVTELLNEKSLDVP